MSRQEELREIRSAICQEQKRACEVECTAKAVAVTGLRRILEMVDTLLLQEEA